MRSGKIELRDLYSLEEYARRRDDFRSRVMAHKRNRQLAVGGHLRLYFEDRLTMLYQVQEILRVEKIFEEEDIRQELEAYNPLIPDGRNWKATMMIEYPDPQVRRENLARLIGIDRAVWVRAGGCDKVFPVTNEDLIRETEDKTSAVHFLRFELGDEMIQAVKNGGEVHAGADHPQYTASVVAPPKVRDSLAEDLA